MGSVVKTTALHYQMTYTTLHVATRGTSSMYALRPANFETPVEFRLTLLPPGSSLSSCIDACSSKRAQQASSPECLPPLQPLHPHGNSGGSTRRRQLPLRRPCSSTNTRCLVYRSLLLPSRLIRCSRVPKRSRRTKQRSRSSNARSASSDALVEWARSCRRGSKQGGLRSESADA